LLIVEPADKPGSVVDNHSSGTGVTTGLMRPTRRHRGPRFCLPIWSCFEWGLPCHEVLPPARCALTAPFHPYLPTPLTVGAGGIFSAALSVGSRPPGVTWHPALRSPDFPHRASRKTAARLPGRLQALFSSTVMRIDSLGTDLVWIFYRKLRELRKLIWLDRCEPDTCFYFRAVKVDRPNWNKKHSLVTEGYPFVKMGKAQH